VATIKIFALGDGFVKCCHVVLLCSGIHKCEFLDESLMGVCTEPDPEEMRQLFEVERIISDEQYASEDFAAAM
jgi:hypothetical protein